MILKHGFGTLKIGNGIIPNTYIPLMNTLFKTKFLFLPRNTKLIIKTGNEILQTGSGIVCLTSMPQMKKLIVQNISYYYQEVQNLH